MIWLLAVMKIPKEKHRQGEEQNREERIRIEKERDECGACRILIALAKSTSCLKIRLNERRRDTKESRDI